MPRPQLRPFAKGVLFLVFARSDLRENSQQQEGNQTSSRTSKHLSSSSQRAQTPRVYQKVVSMSSILSPDKVQELEPKLRMAS
jgi:hypothetical protein